uniref:BAG domain-containing protein n=1 Tax=Triticum urartu TaxID=4572 RepID=A0A8R7UJY6_TRIUA
MTELVKLDAIAADGEVKAQRRLQEKRVQKYVETLDVIRAKNAAAPKANGTGNGQAKGDRSLHLPPRPPPVSQRRQFKQQPAPATGKAAAAPPTASWETFDLLSSMRRRPRPRRPHHGGRDDHDEAGQQQQQHLADPAVRLGALLAATRVPPVTAAWYMPLPSLIPFSCVHPSIDLSALLCSIRSDQSSADCLLRLFILSFSRWFLLPPPFFFYICSECMYVCMYIKQHKMNRPWPVKWRACSSIPSRPCRE